MLTLFYPVIALSTEYVAFGHVCLESSKTLSVKILNKTGRYLMIFIDKLHFC